MPQKGQSVSEATKRQIRRAQTKYKPAYCGELIEYFLAPKSSKGWRRELDVSKVVDGQIYDGKVPVYIPTLTGFCDYIGISLPTFYKWVDIYEEFGDAYEEAMESKRELLNSYALAGEVNPVFAKYMLESWNPHKRKRPIEERVEAQDGSEPPENAQEGAEKPAGINVSITVKLPKELTGDGEGENEDGTEH